MLDPIQRAVAGGQKGFRITWETDHLGSEDVQSAEVGLRTFYAQLWSPLRLCRGEGRGSTSHVTFFIPVIQFKSNSSQMEEGRRGKLGGGPGRKRLRQTARGLKHLIEHGDGIISMIRGRDGAAACTLMYARAPARSKVQHRPSAIIDNETREEL